MVVSRRKSSLPILQSSLPSVFWNMAVSISNRPYSLMAHSSHWRTWSWDHNDGSAGGQKKKKREVYWLHNKCFWTDTKEDRVSRASYLTKVKEGGEMNKLETEFCISSRPCSDTCKYSWSYFIHMDSVCLSGMAHIKFQVNNLSKNSIHSEIPSLLFRLCRMFYIVPYGKKVKQSSTCCTTVKVNSICKYSLTQSGKQTQT